MNGRGLAESSSGEGFCPTYVRRVPANLQVLWLVGEGPQALAPPTPAVAGVRPPSPTAP